MAQGGLDIDHGVVFERPFRRARWTCLWGTAIAAGLLAIACLLDVGLRLGPVSLDLRGARAHLEWDPRPPRADRSPPPAFRVRPRDEPVSAGWIMSDGHVYPDWWFVRLPLWWFVAAFGLTGGTLEFLARRRRPPGHCPRCGYDLTGLTPSGGVLRCPECGVRDPEGSGGIAGTQGQGRPRN